MCFSLVTCIVLSIFQTWGPVFACSRLGTLFIYRHGTSFHYADNTQMYLPIRSTDHGVYWRWVAARLLSRTKWWDHITPVLASLHWLPVCFRIDFQIWLFIFKTLCGLDPLYISDILVLYTSVHTLRSSGRGLWSVPEARQLKKPGQQFARGDQLS